MDRNIDTTANSHKGNVGLFTILFVAIFLIIYIAIFSGVIYGVYTGELQQYWNSLPGTAQVNVITSGLTALGLISSAVILPFIFKDRIRNIESMANELEKTLEKTQEELSGYKQQLSGQLEEFKGSAQERMQTLVDESQRALTEYSEEVNKKFEDLDRKTFDAIEELKKVQNGMYEAVGAILGQGQIVNPSHAAQTVDGLYESVKYQIEKRYRNKKNKSPKSREQLAQHRSFSNAYLKIMRDYDVISSDEFREIMELKGIRFQHAKIDPSQYDTIRKLQEFVSAFAHSSESENEFDMQSAS